MEIGEVFELSIVRQEANFDRACNSAYKYTIDHFGIDADGHSSKVKEWERTTCMIVIKFDEYRRVGAEHIYFFHTWITKDDD